MANSSDHDPRMIAKLKLASDLKRSRRDAGEPSLREIQTLSGGNITIATISRVLNGKAEASWYFVKQFLLACDVAPDTVDTVWRSKWLQMMDVLHPLDVEPDLAGDRPLVAASDGTTCAECGLVIGDLDVHRAWHDAQAGPAPSPRSTTLRSVPDAQDAGASWRQRRKAS